ncbi:prohead protease/major capsid protein fusion protein [Undibacterium sp. Ji22W]|uniref:prohead protease/major capsid protein fusion protein n=1 Tax=Undibacterium sp. Ji22W TaxID=3413038 RepID=UPI003BF30FBC
MPQPLTVERKEVSSELPLSTWSAPIVKVKDNRTVDVIWTAGASVRRYDWLRDRYYMEELSQDANATRMARLQSGRAPFLDCHNQWSLQNVLGVIENATAPSDGGTATVRFSKRDDVEPIYQDVLDKILSSVSLGARIHRMEMIAPDVEGNKEWIYRALDWEPYEVSLVPIGADVDAIVRSEDPNAPKPKKPTMFACEMIEVTRSISPTDEAAATSTTTKGNTMKTPEEMAALQRAADAALEALNVARAQQGTQSQAPATPPNNASQSDASSTDAAATERQRVKDIRDTVRASTLSDKDKLIDGYVDRGLSMDAVREDILKRMAEASNANTLRTQGGVRIETVSDQTEVRREAMINALSHRIAPSAVTLTDAGRQYRGLSLRELCRDGLEAMGISTRGMSPMQLASAALGMSDVTRALGTTDLPLIFGGVITRTMRGAYAGAPKTFTRWAKKGTLSDFRPVTRVAFDAATRLEKINQDGEYKYGTLMEGGEVIQLATYGKIVPFTRQMIINDDLSALQRMPQFFGRSAANMESDIVYGILTANAALSDGKALFHADHNNLAAAGAKITIDSLSAGRAAMRTQVSPAGEPMNGAPKFLLAPAALETTAAQYTSNAYTPTKSADQNVFQGLLEPVIESRLDAASTTAWYLIGDAGACDTVEYCYLDGEEGLFTEQSVDFDSDGLKVKGRIDFAAKAIDHRAMYKNPGA